jgi:hypothetical protein
MIVVISPMNERNTIRGDWNTSINVQFGTIKEKNNDRTALVNSIRNADNFTMMAN